MEDQNYFMMMPKDFVEEIRQLAKDVNVLINHMPNSGNSSALGEWVPESEAQKTLGRKTTWFYYKRKSGELKGRKRGNKWWYAKSEILKFIET